MLPVNNVELTVIRFGKFQRRVVTAFCSIHGLARGRIVVRCKPDPSASGAHLDADRPSLSESTIELLPHGRRSHSPRHAHGALHALSFSREPFGVNALQYGRVVPVRKLSSLASKNLIRLFVYREIRISFLLRAIFQASHPTQSILKSKTEHDNGDKANDVTGKSSERIDW